MKRHLPLRVVYVITDLEVGGVPLHLYRLVTRLPRELVRPRVISLADIGPVGAMLQEQGIDVSGCMAGSAGDMPALFRLWKQLQSERADLIHSLLFHANIACRLIGPLAGIRPCRIINEIQTVEIERRWHLRVDQLTCRLCRVEVGNSPSVVAHLRDQGHIPASRLACMWGAVNLAEIDAASPANRTDWGIAPEKILLLWTGRFDPVKGFEEMIEGFVQAAGHLPLHLMLIGDGPYRDQVKALIDSRRIEQMVTLAGQRSDVPSLLKMADLFLFCSRTEGLPNSILEAMAAELPIVCTDVPGCRDLIHHQETGWLVPPVSPAAIAGGITELVTNRAKAVRLGRAARCWVESRVDVIHLGKRWADFYTKLLSAADN